MPLLIVAILTPHPGSQAIFHEYETKAAVLMARHGGAIERTIVEEPAEPGKPIREVHIVTFPNLEAFNNYRTDPDLTSLAEMRKTSIAHTELLFGQQGPDYMALSKQ